MGIPAFHIASSLKLIIAQRLARKLCHLCKIKREDYTAHSLKELGFNPVDIPTLTLYKAQGCTQCNNGYQGRIGLFEVMPITKTLMELIQNGSNALTILKQAEQEGMLTLYQSGLQKIKEGITSIEEINRVTVEID